MRNPHIQTIQEREDLFSIPIILPTLKNQRRIIERVCSHHNRFQRRQIPKTEEAIVTKCHIIDLNRFQMGTVADGIVAISSLTVSHIIILDGIRETPSANHHSLQCIQSIKLKGASGQKALISNLNRFQPRKSLQNQLRSIIIVACQIRFFD